MKFDNGKNLFDEFDAFWSSSLAESLIRGKPDNESVLETRITALSDLVDTTMKPIIFDADNGGRPEHIPFLISSWRGREFQRSNGRQNWSQEKFFIFRSK